jgi:hypothetical protein
MLHVEYDLKGSFGVKKKPNEKKKAGLKGLGVKTN